MELSTTVTAEQLKSRNQHFYGNNYVKDERIARDAEIINARMTGLDQIDQMRVGDFLRLKSGEMARVAHHWGDSIQPSHKLGGSYYLGNRGADFSGALDSAIPIDQFRLTSETKQGSIWIFHSDFWGAGRAVYASPTWRVYEQI